MKFTGFGFLFVMLSVTFALSQGRDFRTHTRSMVRETVFNTGELGRTFDRGTGGMPEGFSSMEWPPNSRMILDGSQYAGQHNSFGGGFWVAGTPAGGTHLYDFCGAVTANNGDATLVEGVYSDPISINRIENYPLLSNGDVNPAYNPDEAEEIIISRWKTHTLGVTVTRTSRAWSFPGYDDFIIFEYEIENTTGTTITDMFVTFPYGFGPSMFGYQRTHNRWGEGDYRANQQFARFDLKRWMTYNHDRQGKPEADANRFGDWSTEGNRGGLNSPQAAGIVTLHYDYEHLAVKGQTTIIVNRQDSMVVWDENNKIKQPYLNRYENANLYPTKTQAWLDPAQDRKTGPFQGRNDSLYFLSFAGPDGQPGYWIGRGKPS
ncbi:MAG: T9SS C-terminal target domain-containing protein, partial [Bacteroidetes bacterium]